MANYNSGSAKDISADVVNRVSGQTYAQTSDPATTWFAPLRPLQTVAPVDSPARALDYTSGVNLLINPRSDEVVSYKQMRFVAENVTLVTMAIETRKDQIAKQRWNIRIKPEALEGRSIEQKLAAKKDKRIAFVRDFLRHPDRESNWDNWIRKLIHDVLVTDSPCVELQRSLGGTPYALRLLDGTTITRKINLDGSTPQPGQTGPDGSTLNPIDNSSYDTAYQQIIKGAPYINFTTRDLIFRPRNQRVHKLYGYSPVEQTIFHSNMILRRDISKMNFYTEGNIPPALASVTEDWTADQIQDFQQKFDAVNSGDLANTRKLQFIPKLSQLYFLKEAMLKDDADEWFARIILYAFSLPPTALTKQMNRATAQQAQESADDEGLAPLMLWVGNLLNDIIEQYFGFADLEFVWTPERVIDPKIQAEVHKTYLDDGVMTRNQILSELGLDPQPGGDELTVTTANGLQLFSEAVMPLADKIESGIVADPTAPKVVPAPPAPDAKDEAKPDDKADTKILRNILAEHLMNVYEDLRPELRDPTIVAKLAEIEARG